MQPKEEKILNYLNGFSEDKDKAEIDSWRDLSEGNELEFKKIQKLYALSEVNVDTFEPSIDQAWNKLNSKLFEVNQDIQTNSEEGKVVRMNMTVFYKVAAVLAIAFGLSYFFLNDSTNQDLIRIATVTGQVELVALADGSKVWVNENSTFSYPKEFDNDERKVILDGEAFFDVAKDKERPFTITANSTLVKVLGTSFNVRSEENFASVNVVTGKVAFGVNGNNSQVVLERGQSGIYNKGRLTKSNQYNVNELAWRTGKLVFKSTKLSDVATILEQHYSKEIILSEGISNCLITSEFDGAEFSEVLEVLSSIANIQYETREGKIYLSGPGC